MAVLNPEALDILSADIDNKLDIRKEMLGRLKMRPCFDNAVV